MEIMEFQRNAAENKKGKERFEKAENE